MKFKPLTADEVEFDIILLPADEPVRGAFATGDDAQDKAWEDEIIERLEYGDLWAWCTVKVIAKWRNFEGDSYLGSCSYKSEKDFIDADDYYPDMKAEALEDLNLDIQYRLEKLADRLEA